MFETNRWKIVRGDTVMIMAGKEKGQIGTVLEVLRDKARPKVKVEGRNLCMKSFRTEEGPTLLSVEAPLHYSNVQHVDPITGKAVRIGYKYLEDGTKVRFTRGRNASGTVVPRSEILKQRTPRPPPGEKDTPAEEAARVTYVPGDMPSLLRAVAAADAARQYSTWLGRGNTLPHLRPLLAKSSPGVWAGARTRWRGFAASAA
ncbi:hypothetical protein WJX81_003857 [Elliptochloris bilobata]|uniref:KOW domain-containing protein n=1 Tax=Elliptochloris bilobata TaxID=381761 RepID=A0AAW1RNB4_9CHLO